MSKDVTPIKQEIPHLDYPSPDQPNSNQNHQTFDTIQKHFEEEKSDSKNNFMLSPIENVSPTKTLNVSAPSLVEEHSKYEHVL